MCDVWVADRGTRKGQYSTVEIYFTDESWAVEFEVFNKKHQVPVGVTTYIADAVSIYKFSIMLTLICFDDFTESS